MDDWLNGDPPCECTKPSSGDFRDGVLWPDENGVNTFVLRGGLWVRIHCPDCLGTGRKGRAKVVADLVGGPGPVPR